MTNADFHNIYLFLTTKDNWPTGGYMLIEDNSANMVG